MPSGSPGAVTVAWGWAWPSPYSAMPQSASTTYSFVRTASAGSAAVGAGSAASGAGSDASGAGSDASGAGSAASGAGSDASGAGSDAFSVGRGASAAVRGDASGATAVSAIAANPLSSSASAISIPIHRLNLMWVPPQYDAVFTQSKVIS